MGGLDLTANVVCKPCNEGWMSDIESKYAQPAMEALIIGGKTDFTISKARAKAIALFAFKTAVVIDHMGGDPPFFRRSLRYAFAAKQIIPPDVQMWFAGFLPMASGRIDTDYREASISQSRRLKLYVCTYLVGHFVFQVVCARYCAIPSFSPKEGFEHLAVPFWPRLPKNVRWPPADVIRTPTDIVRFSERWRVLGFR